MKYYITGSVASGKTTYAKNLSAQLNIPFYEADCIVYVKNENGRRKRAPDEQTAEIKRIDALGDWIIEGVYRRSYHCLLDMADKIIFLDTPLRIRKRRIYTRFIKQQLHIEPCEYKSDLHMLKMMFKWTDDFEKNREQFDAVLNDYDEKLVIIRA